MIKNEADLGSFLPRQQHRERDKRRLLRAPICLFLPTGTASVLLCFCFLSARPPNTPSVDLTRSVEQISEMKGEPAWMRTFRLRSLELFEKRPMPT